MFDPNSLYMTFVYNIAMFIRNLMFSSILTGYHESYMMLFSNHFYMFCNQKASKGYKICINRFVPRFCADQHLDPSPLYTFFTYSPESYKNAHPRLCIKMFVLCLFLFKDLEPSPLYSIFV